MASRNVHALYGGFYTCVRAGLSVEALAGEPRSLIRGDQD
jgi:hypothetical protein